MSNVACWSESPALENGDVAHCRQRSGHAGPCGRDYSTDREWCALCDPTAWIEDVVETCRHIPEWKRDQIREAMAAGNA